MEIDRKLKLSLAKVDFVCSNFLCQNFLSLVGVEGGRSEPTLASNLFTSIPPWTEGGGGGSLDLQTMSKV